MYATIIGWAARKKGDDGPLLAAARSLVRLLLIAVGEFQRNELSLRASALTFTILLSLVPMLALSTAVVKGLGGDDRMRQLSYSYVASLEEAELDDTATSTGENEAAAARSEAANLTGHLRAALDRIFDYVDRTNFTTLGSIGMAGILLSVLLVLGHIEAAMNAIWKAAAGRTLLRKLADYLALLVVLPIAGNVAFAAAAFLESPALAAKLTTLLPFAWMQTVLLKMLPVLVISVVLYAIYIFFPNTRVENLPAFCGATLAAIGWFSLQNLYISLQIGVANYNAIYGSFASLPLFLVWVYLGWLFVLGGAQLAFAWQHRHSFPLLPPTADATLRLDCAFTIMARVQAGFLGGDILRQSDLVTGITAYPPELVAQLTTELVATGHLHTSASDGRLLPARAYFNPLT
jgi:membrane protein